MSSKREGFSVEILQVPDRSLPTKEEDDSAHALKFIVGTRQRLPRLCTSIASISWTRYEGETNDTCTLVDKPKNKNVLPGKWVDKVKYKARYVAKGFARIEGLDFFETYAPTCKAETFRILLQYRKINTLIKLLIENGFQLSRNDYCPFVRQEADGTFSYVYTPIDRRHHIRRSK